MHYNYENQHRAEMLFPGSWVASFSFDIFFWSSSVLYTMGDQSLSVQCCSDNVHVQAINLIIFALRPNNHLTWTWSWTWFTTRLLIFSRLFTLALDRDRYKCAILIKYGWYLTKGERKAVGCGIIFFFKLLCDLLLKSGTIWFASWWGFSQLFSLFHDNHGMKTVSWPHTGTQSIYLSTCCFGSGFVLTTSTVPVRDSGWELRFNWIQNPLSSWEYLKGFVQFLDQVTT